jgi:hypothetical protein
VTGVTRPVTAADLAAAANAGVGAPEGQRMLRVALAYAALGLPVLPLHHMVGDSSCSCGNDTHVLGGLEERNIAKHPRTANGVLDASTDRTVITSWWWRWPSANPAIATGHGIDVIDLDEQDAWRDIADLIAAGRLPAAIAYASTGRVGGLHVVIPSTGAGNGSRLLPGVDYRGRKGYVAVVPTVHRSGRMYAWTPMPLPAGDPVRGATFKPDPRWLLGSALKSSPASSSPSADGRRHAWATRRLQEQAARLFRSSDGSHNDRVWSAGVAMGAVTADGWVQRADVERVLLDAYTAAGGTNLEKAGETLTRALDRSAHNSLPVLADREKRDPAEDVALVRAWSASVTMSGGRRVVLEWILREAEKRGTTTLRLAVRGLMENAGVSRSTACRALQWLRERGVLATVTAGSKRDATAGVYRLSVPGENGTARQAEQVPTIDGRVSTNLMQAASVTIGHGLWSGRRGMERGLTHSDRRLIAALPKEEGVTIGCAEWAKVAGVHRATASAAARYDKPDSLASLGLVTRAARGQIAATVRGRHLAAVLRGEVADLMLVDELAAELGVTGRREQRAAAVAIERLRHSAGLLPAIIKAAFLGLAGSPRDLIMLRAIMPTAAVDAMSDLLAWLDDTPNPRPVRQAVFDVVDAIAFADMTVPAEARALVFEWAMLTTADLLNVGVWSRSPYVRALAEVIVGIRRCLAMTRPTSQNVSTVDERSTTAKDAEAIATANAMLLIVQMPSIGEVAAAHDTGTKSPWRVSYTGGGNTILPGYKPLGAQFAALRAVPARWAPADRDQDDQGLSRAA